MNSPRRIRYYCIILCTLLSFFSARNLNAQWKKVFDFGKPIYSIYFQQFSNKPTIGFVGTGLSATDPSKLWQTTDGGLTWSSISYSPDNNGYYAKPYCFTFKNRLVGWFCDFGNVASSLYHTTDGGSTWVINTFMDANSVYYNPSNGYVLGSCNSGSYIYSNDGGNTFNKVKIPGITFNLNIAFSDDLHGVISPSGGFDKLLYTFDAGLTWTPINLEGDLFQPVGLSGSTIFFALREGTSLHNSGVLIRSSDGGRTWQEIYQYKDPSYLSVTGMLQTGIQGVLFFQTAKDNSDGIMVSNDSGITFVSLCGPINTYDTRFYVRDSFIYAGDKFGGLWLNTTGIGSNSTPQLAFNKIILSTPGCKQFDTTITFSFFDSCNGIQAKLASASISGSNNFLFSSPSAIPRTIHPDDSLLISYNPNSSSPDTSQLHLRFHLGWKDFDTTIQLFGSGRIPKENVQFIPTLSTNTASAGMLIDLSVKPDKIITGKALHSISFDLNYIGDLLNYNSVLSSNPLATLTKGTITHTGRIETFPITITGNDLSLDPSQAIADIKFQVMVSDTTKTAITISNLKLNGGDADYQNCILSADTSSTNFTLNFQCGDTMLYNYLRIGDQIKITSMRPNPAQDEIEIALQSGLKQDANVEIFNALGARVYFGAKNLVVGENKVHLDTKGLSSGVYLVRIGNVSQSLVISR